MQLVDIEKLEYEPFLMEDGETVDYISAENLWKAPRVDPVKHAKWVLDVRPLISEPDSVFVEHVCSNCGQVDARKWTHNMLWNNPEYRDTYKPELSNYCRKCGRKMDLRELEELYEKYKHEWCEARGYILEVVEERGGINGECYVCFDEWYDNEYQERNQLF